MHLVKDGEHAALGVSTLMVELIEYILEFCIESPCLGEGLRLFFKNLKEPADTLGYTSEVGPAGEGAVVVVGTEALHLWIDDDEGGRPMGAWAVVGV